MKSRRPLALVLALAAAVFFAVRAASPPRSVTLSWDYPTNELSTDIVFKVWTSTDVTVPVTNWTLITNVVGTNTSVTFSVQPGVHFYALTASSVFWKLDSVFSNVAATPPEPRSDVNLTVKGPP